LQSAVARIDSEARAVRIGFDNHQVARLKQVSVRIYLDHDFEN
jgi:hypothetical protein